MRFRWLETAGFELESAGERLLIDPHLTRNARAFPVQELRPGDFAETRALLLTHGHFDHYRDTPEIARISGCRVLASGSVCARLSLQGIPWNRLEPVGGGGEYLIGPFRVEAVPSRHVVFDLPLVLRTTARCLSHLPLLLEGGSLMAGAGEVFGYLIEAEGKTLFHLGSAFMHNGSLGGRKVNVFFVPVQGHSDIAALAARLVEEVRPDIVVPHHHDDFHPPLSQNVDLAPFKRELEKMLPRVRLLVPSLNSWYEV